MKNDNKNISEVSLVYKSRIKASERPKVTCSRDAFKLLLDHWNPDTIEHVEEFKMLLLNRSNSVLGIIDIAKGGISGCVADIRVIFQAAIKANASGILVAHCHPSGNLNPSESDTKLTQRIKDAGNLIDIQLLDHLILTPDGEYFSWADNGLI
jgi:DNA repair protein RadC